MEYPHRQYVLYSLSRKMPPHSINADCLSKRLAPPDDDFLAELTNELGVFPSSWRPQVERRNVSFRRWLRDKGLLHIWSRGDDVEEAMSILQRRGLRTDFETIMLGHGDIDQAHKELSLKYSERAVPSKKGLQAFYTYFWNIGLMSSQGIFDYIGASQDREEYEDAARGDLITAYSRLGIQQEISQEQLLQQMMMMGFAAAQRGTRDMGMIGGQALAGLTAAAIAGANAGVMLQELRDSRGGDTSLRRKAAEFMSRKVPRKAIPSIDDLQRDVLNAEDIEAGEGNVHRLTDRRG